MKKTHWMFTILILLSLVLASCAQATQAPEATEPPVVETEPPAEATEPPAEATEPPAEATEPPAAERKVATFIWTQEFDTLNPLYTNMWFAAITHQLWLSYAWDFDDQGNPNPVLITEMPSQDNGGISEDGTTITLTLRDDIFWSDGTPVTADDFIFTWQMTIDPNNTVAQVSPYDLLTSVEAPDPKTVVMNFAEPFAAWAGTMWHSVLPAHVLRPVYEAEGTIDNAEWNRNPTVGVGPYNFAEWESGSYARFVANENFWLGKPAIDEVFFRFVPDDASQVAALKAGEGDLGTFIAYSDIPGLQDAGVNIVTVFSGYNEGWYMNLSPEKGHPALQDVRVRQALAYGFDRFTLNKDLLLGLTVPAATYWDNTPYAFPDAEPYPYDPAMANQLLDEAGWVDSNGDGTRDKDGVELVLRYGTTTREIRQDTQAVVQQQYQEIGVGVELLSYDSDIFFGGYGDGGPSATGELDISEWSDTTDYPDPNMAYWLCSEIPSDESPAGVNWQYICDEELDALFQLQNTQVDFAERQATFHQISKIVFDKVYWLGVWQDPDTFAIGPRLQNVKISGSTPFYNIYEWDLVP
jgi:peptide/nickel transport system substrate-binding protein